MAVVSTPSAPSQSESARVQDFAWARFRQVAKWALLAYLITAGTIECAFLRDHLSGGPLIVLTLSLAVYAMQVPTLIAFTVARYEQPGNRSARTPPLDPAIAAV